MIYSLPIIAYLIGSISSAIIVARILRLPDPRTVGSGNPGATNILRSGSKSAAAVTLTGDLLKGVIPVVLARYLDVEPILMAAVMLTAFLGHLFPIFFRFQGGKGVATAFGVYLGLNPWLALLLAAVWLGVAIIGRYSSLAALTAAVVAPFLLGFFGFAVPIVACGILITVLLLWRHKANINRLIRGEESKIGQ